MASAHNGPRSRTRNESRHDKRSHTRQRGFQVMAYLKSCIVCQADGHRDIVALLRCGLDLKLPTRPTRVGLRIIRCPKFLADRPLLQFDDAPRLDVEN